LLRICSPGGVALLLSERGDYAILKMLGSGPTDVGNHGSEIRRSARSELAAVKGVCLDEGP